MAWRVVEWTIGTLAAVLALGLTAYSAAGPFWPTPPEIVLQDGDRSSSVPLAFNIVSHNKFFPVDEARLVCHLDLLYFVDTENKTGIERDAEFVGPTIRVPSTYDCGSDFVRVKQDGSVEFGLPNGSSMHTQPGAFKGPVTVVKMCVMIGGSYVSRGFTGSVPTVGYQWPRAPRGTGWIREPITFDVDQDKWIPPGSYLEAAWGLRRLVKEVPSKIKPLDPDALRCDAPPKQ
jgi:hypothetical protein